ncbi:MAG: N-acetylmuramoyl-L-alanine amidase [Clostridia bacterium]|nr:N-acetylmuramoyl-L-alanine amidase [Clostridia bacterium]
MKKRTVLTVIFCFAFIVLFSVFFYFFSDISKAVVLQKRIDSLPTIIVDAGHGGADGGAVALDNTAEKDYNLDIALKLEQILKINGFKVIMTRTEDIMTCDEGLNSLRSKKVSDIHNRFGLIENNPDAIFISIHQNKFPDSSQHGTQVFYSGNNSESKILADTIQQTIVNAIQKDNVRQTKKSGTQIYLLYHSKIPSVLVECGFISNYEDLQKLRTDEYKTMMAMLIADGIIKYKTGD